MHPPTSLLQRLPDLPRWVEARALLLDASCEITGLANTPELSCLLRDPDDGTVFVIGHPAGEALHAAVQQEVRGEVIAGWEEADWLTATLSGWTPARIFVHHLPESVPAEVGHKKVRVAFLDPSVLDHLPVDEELRTELQSGAEHSPIAATFVDDHPVAFCYAGAVTETLWDISIDTLPDHRRKGYAALCVTFMIRYMQGQGKTPVWQALEDNPASWQLAKKLGFTPADDLVIFEPPPRSS